MGVSGFNKVVVNAVCYDDVAVFVTAYLRAAARGKVFMFRGSAAVVKVLGAVSDQPLLRREDLMCADQRNGGIIVVGSHVRKPQCSWKHCKRAARRSNTSVLM